MTTPASSASATRINTGRSASAFRNTTILGTLLQLVMVVSGHWVEFIKLNVFAVGGMLISALAGVIYARLARVDRKKSAIQGAIVGGLCASIGIAVSFFLGDVPANILVLGTLSSAVTGAIGGAIAGGTR
jgi:hypothetical protein